MDGQWFASVFLPWALTEGEGLQVDERHGLVGGWVQCRSMWRCGVSGRVACEWEIIVCTNERGQLIDSEPAHSQTISRLLPPPMVSPLPALPGGDTPPPAALPAQACTYPRRCSPCALPGNYRRMQGAWLASLPGGTACRARCSIMLPAPLSHIVRSEARPGRIAHTLGEQCRMMAQCALQ